MIYRHLDNYGDEVISHSRLKDAMTFLMSLLKKTELPDGKYIWDQEHPDELFANVQTYQSKNFEDGHFESHKKYADLQYVISGEEFLYVPGASFASLREKVPYSVEKDCALQFLLPEQECSRFLLKPETFVVLFPNEAHAPGIATHHGKTEIRKIVIKIKY